MFYWQRLESSTWNPESMTWNPEFNTVKRHDWAARPPLETNELNGRISKGAKTWFPGIKSTQINEIWQGNDPLCEKKRRKSRQKNLLFCAWYLPIAPLLLFLVMWRPITFSLCKHQSFGFFSSILTLGFKGNVGHTHKHKIYSFSFILSWCSSLRPQVQFVSFFRQRHYQGGATVFIALSTLSNGPFFVL